MTSHFVKWRPSSKLRHVVDKLVVAALIVAGVHFLLIFVTAGYTWDFGPFRVSTSDFVRPLLVWLSVGMVAMGLWLGKQGVSEASWSRSPWLLLLGVILIYSLNGRALTAGDTIPASYLPFSLIRELDFDLDEFPFLYVGGMPWFVQNVGAHVVSAYPPWAGVLATPIYLLPILGGLSAPSPWVHDLEKLSATLITALSVGLLWCTLRRLTSAKVAWVVAIVYAFGTSSWSSSSQALWQHGPSQLFLTLMMYWLVRGVEEPRFSGYAGFALASAVLCRPSNALMTLPIIAYVLVQRRAQFFRFCLAALPPCLAFLTYNLHYNGSPLRAGFAVGIIDPVRLWSLGAHLFKTPILEGLAGVLISPGRGLFIYSPVLLLACIGIVMAWKDRKQVLLRYLSLAPLPIVLLTAKWINWWGGGSYGPRLLADITPLLCLYLYLPFERVQSWRAARYVVMGLVLLSISLHGLRVFGGGDWNGHPNVDRHPERLWSWIASPPVYHGQNLLKDLTAKMKRLTLRQPTSLDSPQELAALYRLQAFPLGAVLPANSFLMCQVDVTNSGTAAWLARAKWERGEVRLRWQWFLNGREVTSASGGWLIGYDVLPGETYRFALEIMAPPEAGAYTLELGLVSIGVTSFEEHGVVPLIIPVQVASPS